MSKHTRPTSILEQRVGDVYETFFDDAVDVSRLLSIQLTSCNHGRDYRIAMVESPGVVVSLVK